MSGRRDLFAWIPESLVLGNIGPVLLLIGLILLVWSFARVPFAFVAFVAVVLVGTALSFAARDRAGGTSAIPMWRASAGWTAAEFDVRYRQNERGDAVLAEAIEIAKERGYRVDGTPAVEQGRFGPNHRVHLVRAR